MQFRPLACALAFATLSIAQTAPQMTWRGDASGTTFLSIHAKKLKVESKDNATVENQRYRIVDPLPFLRQDVRLHVSEGRGYVHILEQPRADNDFTLTVAIEDRQSGTSPYAIALYWDLGDRPTDRSRNQLKWSGRVEDQIVVSCASNRCTSQALAGAPVMHERVKFQRPLPQRETQVKLEAVEGRGQIRIVEQPSETNNYTAKIEIKDPESGFAEYAFTLSWKEFKGPPLDPLPSETGLVWTGRVQGTIRVTLRGGAALSEVVQGPPIVAEHAIVERPLPAKSGITPQLKKRQGRGTVEIIEYPATKNGYQLVFEIRDTGSSADLYEVEVSW